MGSSPTRSGRWLSITLGAVLAFVGVGGLFGGWALVSDPSGASLGWTTAPLSGSPFPDYLIPGIVLLAVNGVGSLVGAVFAFARHRRAGLLGAGLGLFLMAWIAVQVAVVGLSYWLQPAFLAVGAVELGLAVALGRAAARA